MSLAADPVLAGDLYAAAHLTGRFVLRSGAVSAEYFDKFRFESDPVLLRRVARRMLALIAPDTDALAGLELGGVPIATAMALESGLPAVFVRKAAKTYGTCRAVEGREVKGLNLAIVEDVISTGGAIADGAAHLRGEGASLTSVVCAVWRGAGVPSIAALPGVPVRAAFLQSELSE
ncbi:MAG TPA: phosphoribosyltransferase family protein [Caulobacteraceae bacterium]|jgi:orotate phosphoribosyltransferase|nr:phosphoribosyltransferase family protein [Caulobacteraceae bacterium]